MEAIQAVAKVRCSVIYIFYTGCRLSKRQASLIHVLLVMDRFKSKMEGSLSHVAHALL